MQQYKIDPQVPIKLKKLNANAVGDWEGKKKAAKKEFKRLQKELADLQEVLYAEQKHKILIILQAMDGGGKDGTIRALLEKVDPQGVKIANFKVPTPIELAHDYLWRVHAAVPAKGEMVIFNRSHYEDVLVVRVHEMVPKRIWQKRFEQINSFEKMLTEEGVTILKFYLHISKEEQKQRFIERVSDPQKQWKFNPQDIEERKFWEHYQEAYEEMLNKTSTSWAPWYAIPANNNWYRDLCVASIIIDTLQSLQLKYPTPLANPETYIKAFESEDKRD